MQTHILLIDDDEDEYDIFMTALGNIPGPRCSYAPSAEHGLKLIKADPPHVIFLDVNMPGIDGLKCLASIKNTKAFQNIPVFIYSTADNQSLREAALNLGAEDCLKKPGRISGLEVIIRNALARVVA